MSDKKDEDLNITRRLSSEEINRHAKTKKTSDSSKTQVVGKVNPNKEKTSKINKKSKKTDKKKKKFKDKHPRIATIIKIFILLIILAIIIVAGIFFGALWGGYNLFDLLGDDYKINMDDLVIPYENSIVYDSEGKKLAELSAGPKRKSVSLDQMSKYLPDAYISIEDERFYDHSGVDFKRTGAATLNYITHGGKSSFGGSSITQQVVKNLTNEKEDTAMRKVKEMVKALQVEHFLSKEQILELYLNLIFVGGKDVNGVALGAIYYFNKDVKDLSLAECAYMAAINNTPNSYNPFAKDEKKKQSNIKKGQDRAKVVLKKMLDLGKITDKEYKKAVKELDAGLKFNKGDISVTTEVSYQVDAALSQIVDQIVEENPGMSKDLAEMKLYSGGYKIYTTQVTSIQTRLEQELADTTYLKTSPKGQSSMASMTIVEPGTGKVVACGAGIGEEKTKMYLGYFNYATDLKKQTGSSIKPLAVISPGLETGKITASTVFYDGPTTFPGSSKVYKNEGDYTRTSMTMRTAIERSQNIPNLKAISIIGVDKSKDFCHSIGLKEVTGKEGVALALGGLTTGVSTFQMANAYATISNNGVYVDPIFYTKVEDNEGNIFIEPKSKEDRSTRVMSEQNAYIVKSIMTSPVNGASGTAPYAKINGMDVAAKTGTTNNNYDRWLCEFTNYYAAACWFGYDNSEEVTGFGRNPAGSICTNVMRDIHNGLEPSTFKQPSGIVTANICVDSGMKAGEKCSNVYQEVFTDGTVPAECDRHVMAKVCNETGLLASEFCLNYSETGRLQMPITEEQGSWTSDYTGAPYSMPTQVCPHTASSYKYLD